MAKHARSEIITPKRLIAVGETLYGDNWQNELARATDISQPMLSMMVAGDRRIIKRDFIERLAKLCTKRAGELSAHAEILTKALNKGD